jgi:hypothetical protein
MRSSGLPPADCGSEVSAMPRLAVLVDKHQPVRAVERIGVQVGWSSGRMPAGKETVRIPALDFGGPS